jgi:ABC-type glutathione transport system ATPase component
MQPLVRVEQLTVEYPLPGRRRARHRVLDGVSIDVRRGECVGLVGESGSGKSTLGRAILGLAPVTAGEIHYGDVRIDRLRSRARRRLASEVQVVFQDPFLSLNPSLDVRSILAEPMQAAGRSRREAEARARELLDLVALPESSLDKLPREFSGGQRQRIAIARAISLEPAFIVCDEPVSALDLRTQATILELLRDIQDTTGVAYLFISHDLSVVRSLSHRVAVMNGGEIVEFGYGDQVTSRPRDPYTKRLMLSSPVADPDRQAERRRQRLALPTG